MRDSLHPLVPVLIHEVVDKATRRFREVAVDVAGFVESFHLRDEENLLLIGREHKAINAILNLRHATAVGTVGVHGENLHCITLAIEECNFLAAINPHGVLLRRSCASDACRLRAIYIHHPKLAVRLILLYAFIAYAIKNTRAVGRQLRVGDTAKRKEQLGSKFAIFHRHLRALNDRSLVVGSGIVACSSS